MVSTHKIKYEFQKIEKVSNLKIKSKKEGGELVSHRS